MKLSVTWEKNKSFPSLETQTVKIINFNGWLLNNFLGGLGESISRVLTKNDPVPQEFIATNDTFGESGSPSKLMDKYGLNSNAIVNAVEKVLSRK